jgi:peptidoglycan/LPS O-acetylase OafA/YrhL
MEWLGKLSYSIYLFHRLVSIAFLDAIKRIMGHFGLHHQQIVATATCILLTFVISYLGYKYLEVPARRWLRNAFEPNRRGLSKVEGAIAIQESN